MLTPVAEVMVVAEMTIVGQVDPAVQGVSGTLVAGFVQLVVEKLVPLHVPMMVGAAGSLLLLQSTKSNDSIIDIETSNGRLFFTSQM